MLSLKYKGCAEYKSKSIQSFLLVFCSEINDCSIKCLGSSCMLLCCFTITLIDGCSTKMLSQSDSMSFCQSFWLLGVLPTSILIHSYANYSFFLGNVLSWSLIFTKTSLFIKTLNSPLTWFLWIEKLLFKIFTNILFLPPMEAPDLHLNGIFCALGSSINNFNISATQ